MNAGGIDYNAALYRLRRAQDGQAAAETSKADEPEPKASRSLQQHEGGVRYLSELWPGVVVACSDDRTASLIRVDKRGMYADAGSVFRGHTAAVLHACAFGVRTLVTCSQDATVRVWSRGGGPSSVAGAAGAAATDHAAHHATMRGHGAAVVRVAAVFREGEVVSASRDESLRIWDMLSRTCKRVMRGHFGGVCQLELVFKWGAAPLAISPDGALRVWRRDGSLFVEASVATFYTAHALSAGCDVLCVGAKGGSVFQFRLADAMLSGNGIDALKLERSYDVASEATVLRFVPSSACKHLLLAGFRSGAVALFNTQQGLSIRSFRAHASWVMDLQIKFINEDMVVATCAFDGTIRRAVMNDEDGDLGVVSKLHDKCAAKIVFANKQVLSACTAGLVCCTRTLSTRTSLSTPALVGP